MRAYLWVIFLLFLTDIIFRIAFLYKSAYPRMKTKGEDAVETVLNLAVLIWTVYFLAQ